MASTTSSSLTPATKTPAGTSKSGASSKKTSKEPKADKSLETTVEKLTQSRNKEMSGKNEQTQPVAKAEAGEKDKEKRREPPDQRKKEATLSTPDKAGSKRKETRTGAESNPPAPVVAVPPKEEPQNGERRPDEATPKPSGNLKEASVEDTKTDVSGGCNGPTTIPLSDGKEAAGQPKGSDPVRSKNLSNNVDSVKGSEQVCEGGK